MISKKNLYDYMKTLPWNLERSVIIDLDDYIETLPGRMKRSAKKGSGRIDVWKLCRADWAIRRKGSGWIYGNSVGATGTNIKRPKAKFGYSNCLNIQELCFGRRLGRSRTIRKYCMETPLRRLVYWGQSQNHEFSSIMQWSFFET